MKLHRLVHIQDLFAIKNPVIWLCGVYKAAVYDHVREIAEKNKIHMQSLVVQDTPVEDVEMRCATTFLGQSFVYWLGNCTELTKKKQESLCAYLVRYAGPHQILFYAPESFCAQAAPTWHVISIDDELSVSDMQQIVHKSRDMVYGRTLNSLITHVYQKTDVSVPVEHFLMLYMYARVVGKSVSEFAIQYSEIVSLYQPSLFVLSSHFFSGNDTLFYTEWTKIAHLYQISFWTTFWSEQLWRAYMFIMYMKKGDNQAAYAISKGRLPYSFTKQDWRIISLSIINRTHNQLYELDTLFKNGHSQDWITLFFMRWFKLCRAQNK